MKKLLAAAIAAAFVVPAQSKERISYSLSAMQYQGDVASFVLAVQNKTRQKLWRANFVCHFVTEDMTPFDPQAISFDDIPAKGKVSKRIVSDAGDSAYSALCELTGGRTYEGGEGDGTFWFPEKE